MKDQIVPPSLRIWFLIHFIVDLIVAIPFFLVPTFMLNLLGFQSDPLFLRLIAAALFGIGGVSFLMRNEVREVYLAMLNLKIVWSLSAIVALVWALIQGGVPLLWGFLGVFSLFSCVWMYYRFLRLKKKQKKP
ncbi:hypothetical protein FJZ48_03300 [Candidatus Uhrbacteria bacterium]|nr:hypothetical protein [Candidatus Uhrbacteria bacterium]